jgi:hypothetical protein
MTEKEARIEVITEFQQNPTADRAVQAASDSSGSRRNTVLSEENASFCYDLGLTV